MSLGHIYLTILDYGWFSSGSFDGRREVQLELRMQRQRRKQKQKQNAGSFASLRMTTSRDCGVGVCGGSGW